MKQIFELKLYNKSGKKVINTLYFDCLNDAVLNVTKNKCIITEFLENEKTGLIEHQFGMFYQTYNN